MKLSMITELQLAKEDIMQKQAERMKSQAKAKENRQMTINNKGQRYESK